MFIGQNIYMSDTSWEHGGILIVEACVPWICGYFIVKMLKYDKNSFYADDEYVYKLTVMRNYADMVKMMEEAMGLSLIHI